MKLIQGISLEKKISTDLTTTWIKNWLLNASDTPRKQSSNFTQMHKESMTYTPPAAAFKVKVWYASLHNFLYA